jgi:hypothetical protein
VINGSWKYSPPAADPARKARIAVNDPGRWGLIVLCHNSSLAQAREGRGHDLTRRSFAYLVLNGVANGVCYWQAGGVVLNGYRMSQLIVNTSVGYWLHVHANGMAAAPVPALVPAPASK